MADEEATGATAGTAPETAGHPGEWARVLTAGLAFLRKGRGWSQADLARRSGLHRRTIWLLEQPVGAKPQPTTQTLQALARAFGHVQVSDFWTAVQSAVPSDPGTPLVVGARLRQMVQAFMECTPEQQQLIEGIILCWSAAQRAEAIGQARLLDLDVVLRRGQPLRPTGMKEHDHDRRDPGRQRARPHNTARDS